MEQNFLVLFLVVENFGDHLAVAFVEHKDLPNFFLALTAYDGWTQVQATLRDGWGAAVTDVEVHKQLQDRQHMEHKSISVSC